MRASHETLMKNTMSPHETPMGVGHDMFSWEKQENVLRDRLHTMGLCTFGVRS